MAVIKPPAHYRDLGWDADVITNADGSVDPVLGERLKRENVVARHPAWNFNGKVWWLAGMFYEEVWRYQAPMETLSASTLEELRDAVNAKYGWD